MKCRATHLRRERVIRAKTPLKEAMASMAWLSALRKSDLDTADDGDEGYISSSGIAFEVRRSHSSDTGHL